MSDPTDPNSFADANRLRKVLRFLGLFKMSRYNVALVKRMTDAEWKLAANCIGYDEVSEITRNLIIQTMTDWVRMKTLTVPATVARSILGDIKKLAKKRK